MLTTGENFLAVLAVLVYVAGVIATLAISSLSLALLPWIATLLLYGPVKLAWFWGVATVAIIAGLVGWWLS